MQLCVWKSEKENQKIATRDYTMPNQTLPPCQKWHFKQAKWPDSPYCKTASAHWVTHHSPCYFSNEMILPQCRAGWAKNHWPTDLKWKVKNLFGHRCLLHRLVKYSFHATYPCLPGKETNLLASKYLLRLMKNHITDMSTAITIWQRGGLKQEKKEIENESNKGSLIMKGDHSVLNQTSMLAHFSFFFVYCLNISQTVFIYM